MNFTAAMVQALLAGRKTQTRRVLKDQPPKSHDLVGIYAPHLTAVFNPAGNHRGGDPNDDISVLLPYQLRDRLWVREAHFQSKGIGGYAAGVDPDRDPDGATIDIAYKAGPDYGADVPWASGALMPRWASRLTLIVTDVRVQRVQYISEADAIAEGAPECDIPIDHLCAGARGNFSRLWDTIYAKRPEHQWEANPWVCALTFDVVKANIDEVETGVTVRQIEGRAV
jgi:hypothetical protein